LENLDLEVDDKDMLDLELKLGGDAMDHSRWKAKIEEYRCESN